MKRIRGSVDRWGWWFFAALSIWSAIEGDAFSAACWGFIAGSALHWSDEKREEGAR